MAAKVFSITTGSAVGTITGIIVGDATLDGKAGDLKELIGNPGTTVEDTRIGDATVQTLSCNFAFIAGDAASIQALTFDGTTPVTVTAGALSLTGYLTHWEVKAVKDDWWVGSCTVQKDGA
jgi:hypothetical protein